MGWWTDFWSEDNSKVNSPTVLASLAIGMLTLLAIPITILGACAVYHHVWTLKKGLDQSVTTLILGLVGGGGVGFGAGYGVSRFAGGSPRARPAIPDT